MKAKHKTAKARFESLRVPIDCEVELTFEPAGPANRLIAGNISMGGMFIRGADLYELGTVCEVRFALQEKEPPIRGTAEVLWCRDRDLGPDRPKGIGVRFLDLDLEGKYQVSRLVDQYIQLNELPLQLGTIENNHGETTALRRLTRPGLVVPLVFLVGLVTGSIGSLWLVRPSDGFLEAGLTANSPRAFAATPTADSETPEDESAAGSDHPAIASCIEAWATAWASKDVDEYLSYYSDDFRPVSGLPLEAWKAQRRDRLGRPGFIEVEISQIEIERLDADRAVAQFDQAFASPGYRDRVVKALELAREERRWRIVREEVSTRDDR